MFDNLKRSEISKSLNSVYPNQFVSSIPVENYDEFILDCIAAGFRRKFQFVRITGASRDAVDTALERLRAEGRIEKDGNRYF
ncbi:MAG: hypothetical protein RBR63_05330 [Methanosarcina vacuolata]|jgi:hypothetical protein|nr:hypothetical protein [Methanosarcina vacuolata]